MKTKILEAAGVILRQVDKVRGAPRRIGLLPPAGVGSLGDQAMLDAAMRAIDKRFGDVVFSPVPAHALRQRTAHLARPSTLGSTAGLAWTSATLMIGADVLDGAYNPAAMRERIRILSRINRLGVRVTVTGASFSEAPAPDVVSDLRAAKWLRIHARDPISKQRMEAAFDRPIPLVADLAFLLEPEVASESARHLVVWMDAERARGRRILFVNLAGHTIEESGAEIKEGLFRFLKLLLERDRHSVVLFPHDFRDGFSGDIVGLRELHGRLRDVAPNHVTFLEPPFDSWDAKALAGLADMVVTSRMHFAIAALGMGRAPICLVRKGKFEGLLSFFGMEALAQSPSAVLDTAQFLDRFDAWERDDPAARANIARALPEVQRLAGRNFDDMLPER